MRDTPQLPPPPTLSSALLYQGLIASLSLGVWGVFEGKLWRHDLISVLDGLGLSAWLGLIMAGALSVARLVSARLPARLAWALYCLLGGAWAWSIAEGLDAFTRLDGPHGLLAFLTICSALVSGLVLAIAYGSLPHQARPGRLPRARRAVVTLSVLALLIAMGALMIDKRLFVGIYGPFHQGLRLSALLATLWAVSALSSSLPRRVPRALKRSLSLVVALFMATPLFTLSAHEDGRLYALQGSGWLQGALERVRALTDLDQDGHSGLFGGGDCAPFNSKIHPSARELPDNGVDDNCRAGDLTLKRATFKREEMPTEPPPQSLILITIDTLRPDHMSAFGYGKDTTPEIKAWSEGGVRFTRAYSASAWTSIAVSSMMRGLYPSSLHWTRVYETTKYRLVRLQETSNLPDGEQIRLSFTMPLDEDREPLAETLKARGLYTVAVVDDGYGEFLSPKMGLARGFDRYELVDQLPRFKRTDKGTIDLALKALAERPKGRPFFLWVHLFGPHDPNQKHRGLKSFGRGIKGKYDHEIAFTDQQVGRLLKALKVIRALEAKQGRGLTVALTSDHGELFQGRRRYHGVDLHEQSIRVPMIIEGEGFDAGTSSERPVSLVDLAPTLLTAVNAPPPHAQDGQDLRALLREERERILFAETWYIKSKGDLVRDYVAAFDGTWKATYRRDQQLMSVSRQAEMKRPAKNWGRKTSEARPVINALETYLEANSNDRGASDQRPPDEALKKK